MIQPKLVNDKQARIFVFEREDTQQSVIIEIMIEIFSEWVDLRSLFSHYCPIEANRICIYHPTLNKFQNIRQMMKEIGFIPRELLQPQIILIRYSKIGQSLSGDSQNMQSNAEVDSFSRKDRSKQRTIKEVVQLVRQWRKLHLQHNSKGGKKMSLVEAAKAVGISKKSLDDYYYQLRLGELHNFDFESNINEKIGILRTFVKDIKPEKINKHKNMKHPKNLKIIDQFEQGERDELPAELVLQRIQTIRYNRVEEESWNLVESPFAKEMVANYQSKYFQNFQFQLDDPKDPFFEIDRGFRKKIFDESAEFFEF